MLFRNGPAVGLLSATTFGSQWRSQTISPTLRKNCVTLVDFMLAPNGPSSILNNSNNRGIPAIVTPSAGCEEKRLSWEYSLTFPPLVKHTNPSIKPPVLFEDIANNINGGENPTPTSLRYSLPHRCGAKGTCFPSWPTCRTWLTRLRNILPARQAQMVSPSRWLIFAGVYIYGFCK
ncbi:hypothetical protein HD806DRAFT_467899 [Xylariaceae sp. AK1471]|nr:hypothetical protein HD806DRAFT_467899 [Xylariaceae sp. AK1471]